MTTSEERLKVLKMVQDGKISVEDGIALLEVIGSASSSAPQQPTPPRGTGAAGAESGRWFRVVVTDTRTGRARVNVRMPVSIVAAGMKMGARFAPQVKGLETEQMMDMLRSGMTGKIVDVYDEEDGEHVEVFIE